MEKLQLWLKKNIVSIILMGMLLLLLVSPDAKAWFLRQVIATGIMNPSIEKNVPSSPGSIDFSVTDASGKYINIKDLKGKVVFINFWASWCPPCRAEFPSLQQFYEKYQHNKNIVFITVNLDKNVEIAKAYMEKKQYTVPFLKPAGNIPETIFQGSLPTTVILGKQGNIRLHHEGMANYSSGNFYKQIDQLINQ
ncbi:thioredoxin [Chitinophaga caeni]|uniref:Thioredoxin n=1 Tax=Chitinophaga caeni TaxID=2029983 RepID=A0A291QW81_9BACT|nr:TlpA disulfide reductase family protein [Chitinophaga caeni]ATL48289.1 thioredoxin [Chitinophaga caeni]